jgi:hypothetical protein
MQTEVRDVGFGYSPFPHELARDPGISLQAKGLFAVYGSFVSVTDPTAWPSEAHLCKLCGGKNPHTFRKYKRELLEAGWISQIQRHKENGQYTSVLVTRYYSPMMNPDYRVNSTVGQKSAGGKTASGKSAPQEQEPQETIKKHTQTTAVCVSPVQDLTTEQKDCIEWTITEGLRRGTVKNPAGLRVALCRAALEGALNMGDFEASRSTRARKDQVSKDVLDQVKEWEKEAKESPITPGFLAEQRKLFPGLFTDRSTGG